MFRILLPLLGAAMIAFGVSERGWMWLVAWLGSNFLALGIAHSVGASGLFGKRSNGTLPAWSWLIFLPLHLFTLATWHAIRLFSRESAWSAVTDDLVIGRRLLASEVPGDFDNYVDLTAEFAEPQKIRQRSCYFSFPMLDGAAAPPAELRAAVSRLRPGRTYVHCAQGHGRTATFAITHLMASGRVGGIAQALQLLQTVRPGLRISREQRAIVEKAFAMSTPEN